MSDPERPDAPDAPEPAPAPDIPASPPPDVPPTPETEPATPETEPATPEIEPPAPEIEPSAPEIEPSAPEIEVPPPADPSPSPTPIEIPAPAELPEEIPAPIEIPASEPSSPEMASEAATRVRAPRAASSPGRAASSPARAPSSPGRAPSGAERAASDADRAPSSPGRAASDADRAPSDSDDEVADESTALRLGRRFVRATTDLVELGEELRGHYRRQDGIVVALALAIVFAAAQVHRHLVTPEEVIVREHGLTYARSTAWLAPEPTPVPAPRLVPGIAPLRPREGALPYHVVFTSALDAESRLEVLIDERPPWSNLLTGLELDRRTRYGELYAVDSSQVRSVEGHNWLRTEYHYAFVPELGDQPRIGHAVEYATVDREHLYVMTFHGTPTATERMEDVTAPSLRVDTKTGMPLLPQYGRLARTVRPAAVDAAFSATAMVVAVDVVDGRLRAAGGGSGIVVSADGSVLTNYHVIQAGNPSTPLPPGAPPRLHDLFVIGRFVGVDKPPQLVCAGRPSRAKFDAKLDLALLKCDTDLDGRAWSPASITWPALATRRAPDVRPGQRLWVIGYPDVGGGGLTLTQGLVEGWTGADGALGRDYLKTDAAISHGNSGGPVVDDGGHLVGIATSYRSRVTSDGSVVQTAKLGIVRPLAAADSAIETVRVGWVPREGHNSFDLEPNAVEAPPEGVYLSTKVYDAANDTPVVGALLMILRPGVGAADVDMNRLDEQVVAWGRANADGEVHLKQPVPVPGTYSVLVVARGYEPLIGDHELHLAENTDPYYDPWGIVRIQSR